MYYSLRSPRLKSAGVRISSLSQLLSPSRCKRFTVQGLSQQARPLANRRTDPDDQARKLMVDVFHPAPFFALTLADGSFLSCLLQGFVASEEAMTREMLIPAIAVEARFALLR
jgi:hypothetical protein